MMFDLVKPQNGIVPAFFGGRWRASQSSRAVINPATGSPIVKVAWCGDEEAREAVTAAAAAFETWRLSPVTERETLLSEIASGLRSGEDEISRIITSEQGKPLKESLGEVRYAASYFDWFAAEARRIFGELLPGEAGKRGMVLREPVGVVGVITPWNFPLAMIARKVAAAIAAGCTAVVKPAPETPLTALALARIAELAGAPSGLLNFIPGDAEAIGHVMMTSTAVRKISFTGSTEVGKLLVRQSADTVKRMTLELGGNAPFIVLDDADVESAVDGAMFQKYRNAGQTCICVNRFLCHESVRERFVARLAERSRQLVVGDGANPTTDIGPLINRKAVDKVSGLVSDAVKKGAALTLGTGRATAASLFVGPTVLSGVTPMMDIWRTEIFGPVAAVTSFRTDDEAVQLANNTTSGLAAYVYGRDVGRMWKVAERLEYGMVGVNDTNLSGVQAPFGGVKQSGFGREGSTHGISEYLNLKYLSMAI